MIMRGRQQILVVWVDAIAALTMTIPGGAANGQETMAARLPPGMGELRAVGSYRDGAVVKTVVMH